ncbi:unnamed protein product, partial [Discosporangium mesarthrocarpum]
QGGGALPVLTSECPGWVCYAEKAAPESLPYVSTVKSAQQVMGTLVKGVFPKAWGVPPRSILHVSIMQCFDKKLEASRKDFYHENEDTAEVDIVLTTTEILDLIRLHSSANQLSPPPAGAGNSATKGGDPSRQFFRSLHPSPLNEPVVPGFPTPATSAGAGGGGLDDGGFGGGGSGGYLEYVFRDAAKRFFGVDLRGRPLVYVEGRNGDFRETSLEITREGKAVLRFASAYGFRNIQSILAKARRGRCPYHFVEIMACPSGCVNGGGQAKPK